MKFEERFVVGAPRARVWDYFETQRESVARCIPGLQVVEGTGRDRYRVVIKQSIGHLSATFEMAAVVKDQSAPSSLILSAHGRSVKGARGDLRASAEVLLVESDGGTEVRLLADVVLGGMLGSLGRKVIAKRTAEITAQFAVALAEEIERSAVADDPGGTSG